MKKIRILFISLVILIFLTGITVAGCSDKNSIFEADSSSCNSCGKCVEVCPTDAITMVGGKAVIDVSKCDKCGKCAIICPTDAIR